MPPAVTVLPRPAATAWAALAWAVAGRGITLMAARFPPGSAHRYASCRDRDCERLPCRVYREGFDDGYLAGYQAGQADASE